MKHFVLFCAFLAAATLAAQTPQETYEAFRRQAVADYAAFRDSCNLRYARFMRDAWLECDLRPALPEPPKPKPLPPVLLPDYQREQLIRNQLAKGDELTAPAPMPKPLPHGVKPEGEGEQLINGQPILGQDIPTPAPMPKPLPHGVKPEGEGEQLINGQPILGQDIPTPAPMPKPLPHGVKPEGEGEQLINGQPILGQDMPTPAPMPKLLPHGVKPEGEGEQLINGQPILGQDIPAPAPMPKPLPYAPLSEGERERLIDDRPILFSEIPAPPAPLPQPWPVAPVPNHPQPTEQLIGFSFYGTEATVRYSDSLRFTLPDLSEATLSDRWAACSAPAFDNLLRDCLALRLSHQLSDWAYLHMLNCLADTLCGAQTNEARFLTGWLYCQSGYQMRLAQAADRLCVLAASQHAIYGQPYVELEGTRFYPLSANELRFRVCNVAFPGEQPLDLTVSTEQIFTDSLTTPRALQADLYADVKASVATNRNLISFYDGYPASYYGGDFMTRWALLANTPLEHNTRESLYPTLEAALEGKTELEKVERLLNFVQTAFVYEYDEEVWGEDRAFFAEESLFYPFCDCEDRSILLSRLVRDLVGLPVLLVYYPGHLATAVGFSHDVRGDYILRGGRRYTVCDPTFIGAPVGKTMPGMDNTEAKVIALDR